MLIWIHISVLLLAPTCISLRISTGVFLWLYAGPTDIQMYFSSFDKKGNNVRDRRMRYHVVIEFTGQPISEGDQKKGGKQPKPPPQPPKPKTRKQKREREDDKEKQEENEPRTEEASVLYCVKKLGLYSLVFILRWLC